MTRAWGIVLAGGLAALAVPAGARADEDAEADEGEDELPDDVPAPEEALFALEAEIVSVSSLNPEAVERAPGVVALATRRRIAGTGARTLADVLRSLPGLDVTRTNDGRLRVAVRGLDSPADVLLLINGHRVNDALTGEAFYALPASAIERVEVIRGPGSALYGSNAFLGVVSVTTRDPGTPVLSVRGGTLGTLEGTVATGESVGAWEFRALADLSSASGPDLPVAADALTGTDQQDVSLAPGRLDAHHERVTGVLTLQRGTLRVGGLVIDDTRGPWFGPQDTLVAGGEYHGRMSAVWVEADGELTEGLVLYGRGAFTTWHRDDEVLQRPPGWRSRGGVVDADGDGIVEVFPDGVVERESYRTLRLTGTLRLQWDHDLVGRVLGGVEAGMERLTDPVFETNSEAGLFRPDFDDHNGWAFPETARGHAAPFLQVERALGGWGRVTGGLRYDVTTDTGGQLSPRLALVVTPWDGTVLKLLAASAFRSPTLVEQRNPRPEAAGNPDLEAQTTRTLELAASQELGAHLEARASAYLLQVQDRIDLAQSAGSNLENPYGNREGTRGVGGDVALRARWDGRSQVWLNGALHHTTDAESGVRLEMVAPMAVNLGADVFVWRDLSIGGVVRVRSPREPPEVTFFQRTELAGHDEPWTVLADVTVRWERIVGDLWARLSAYNVTGAAYEEVPRDKRFRLGTGPDGAANLPTEPRAFLAELGHVF